MRRSQTVPAENSHAPVYYTDGFAAFYERYYTGWIRQFTPALRDHLAAHAPHRSLLDLCCGTGETAAGFIAAGWRVTGVDLSEGMLDQARRKLGNELHSGSLRLVRSDATEFALPEPVGACVCLDGALNHLLSPEQVQASFRAVSSALVEGGVFVFDLLEPAHFQRWHYVSFLDEPDAVILKRGVWDEQQQYGMRRISGAFGEGPQCLRIEQNLRSRAYSRADVTAWLRQAGLEPTGCDLATPPCPCGHREPTECHATYRAVKR